MTSSAARVRVGLAEDLKPGTVWTVPLPRDSQQRPQEALVLRTAEGTLHAYLNRCRHLPVPLDGGSRRFLTPDGQHLVCGTHGALYRIGDGQCVAGPCLNLPLSSLPLVDDNGTLFLLVGRLGTGA